MKLGLLIAALSLLGVVDGSAPAAAGDVTTSFWIGGEVANRGRVDLPKLEKFPVAQENVTFFAAGAVQSHSFTGALLWDVLQSAGVIADPSVKNDILRKIVIVTGSDGYEAVFGVGEVAPNFGGSQIMIAYAEDGQPLGQAGFAKVIAPSDKEGGRFVSNIVRIEIRDGGK